MYHQKILHCVVGFAADLISPFATPMMGHPVSPPNNIPPPTTLWHPPQTTHPIQVLQEPANNWDNREDAFINICTETLTLTQTAGTYCLIISEAVSMTKGAPTLSLTGFYSALLGSGILYWRV